MIKGTAIQYSEFGDPESVLSLNKIELPELKEGEVLIKQKASVINPSDFGMIGGVYGRLASLPATAGREGFGEVVELGSNVEGVIKGDWVRIPPDQGAWCSHLIAKAEELMIIPHTVPFEMASMAFINPPTAWRLLRDSHLAEGEWIIQNAGNSAVGITVIQMAKHLGYKTISVVRREECIQPLLDLGGDKVVLEDSGYEKDIKSLTNGGTVRLALNSVGGESAIRLIKSLGNGGTHITFGGMTFEPIRFPTRYLIFNNITLKGFWVDQWYRNRSRERIQIMLDKIYKLMMDNIISIPIEKIYPLSDFKSAIAKAKSPKIGKVLLVTDNE